MLTPHQAGGASSRGSTGNSPPTASRSAPCPNCGAIRRCHIYENNAIRCYYPHKGRGWGHLQQTGDDDGNGAWELRFADAPAKPSAPSEPAAPPRPAKPMGDLQTRHEVYSALLEVSRPAPALIEHLTNERKLTASQIKLGKFSSLPWGALQTGALGIVEERVGRANMLRTPGFRETCHGEMELVAAGPGTLIPYFENGLVAALRLRLDYPGDGGRYRWLSGGGGPSVPNLPYVVTVGTDLNNDATALLVEGEFKALRAAPVMGHLVVSVAGVSSYRVARAALEAHNVRTVILAYDADQWTNSAVAKATLGAAQWLREQGYIVRVALWWSGTPDSETPKGIDDAINAGASICVLADAKVDQYLEALEAHHGRGPVLSLESPTPTELPPQDDAAAASAFVRCREVAERAFEFFSDDGFAYLSPGDGSAISIGGERAKDLLLLKVVEATGKPPSNEVLNKVLDFKRAQVVQQGPHYPVFRRIGRSGGKHYLDLCQGGKVVEITAQGWHIAQSPPGVYFLRTGSKDEALPEPARNGDVLKLGEVINASGPTVKLLIAWLVASLRPGFPYVLIALEGEAGSGKSTAAKVLKYLVDPCRSLLRSPAPTERDLAIASINSHILAFDNIDKIKPAESEWYCRCATGGAFSSRSHYSMTEETVIPMHSPVILTGIEGMVERADMASRVALVTLERPGDDKRIAEADLWPEIDRLRPGILGGLLDALVAGLRGIDSVKVAVAPRMIDFAKFVTAAEDGLPWKKGQAVEVFLETQRDLNEQALGKDRVALAIINLMRHRPTWEGTMTELLSELQAPFGEDYWPTSPHTLSRRVKQALPLLRGRGITMEEKRTGGSRSVTFYSKKEERSVTSVTLPGKSHNGAIPGVTLLGKEASSSVTSVTNGVQESKEQVDEYLRGVPL